MAHRAMMPAIAPAFPWYKNEITMQTQNSAIEASANHIECTPPLEGFSSIKLYLLLFDMFPLRLPEDHFTQKKQNVTDHRTGRI